MGFNPFIGGGGGGGGSVGPQGPAGKSAYQIWLDEGNTGTEEDFLNSLKGETGPAGPEGPQGPQGEQGIQGETGAQGETGPQGEQGPQGEAGEQGPQGVSVTSAQMDGDGYLWLTIGETPVKVGLVKGTPGAKGETGPQGPAGQDGANGTNGTDGADGVGISVIAKTSTVGLVDTYTITLTNGTTATFTVTNGANGTDGQPGAAGAKGDTGETGNGIASITGPTTVGLVDTYTITYTNGDSTTFSITNGANGTDGQPGTNGTNGISVSAATINSSGHLILTLSNGVDIDCGVAKGADGTSIIIKGEYPDTSSLPSTGQQMGDCYVINGHLWVYTNSSETGSVNGFIDAGNLQGPAGRGITSLIINASNELIVTYSDGNSVNLGNIKGPQGDPGQNGTNGTDGNGIVSITKTSTSGLVDTYTILYTDNTSTTFTVTNGAQGPAGQDGNDGNDGATGVGIQSITGPTTVGLVDTYTITLTNNDTYTFTVTNGAQGVQGEKGETGETGPTGPALRSTEIPFTLYANNWTRNVDGTYTYIYSNAQITGNEFLDVGPAMSITQNQLNEFLGLKLVISDVSNGAVTFTAFGEAATNDIPMLLVIEGSYLSVQPQITVDDQMSTSSTNPVQNKVITAALNDKADASDIAVLNSKIDGIDISKNLLSLGTVTAGTGYTVAKRSDGSVAVTTDGTQSGGGGTVTITSSTVLPAGTYIFSGCVGGSSSTYYMRLRNGDGGAEIVTTFGSAKQFTLAEDTSVRIEIVAAGGQIFTDKLFYPSIISADDEGAAFERKSGSNAITTIAGHDRVDIVFGNESYYLVEVTVISRNTPGSVIKIFKYWIDRSNGVDRTTQILDTTSGPEGAPTFTKYYDSNGAACVKITDTYGNRDIIATVIGY